MSYELSVLKVVIENCHLADAVRFRPACKTTRDLVDFRLKSIRECVPEDGLPAPEVVLSDRDAVDFRKRLMSDYSRPRRANCAETLWDRLYGDSAPQRGLEYFLHDAEAVEFLMRLYRQYAWFNKDTVVRCIEMGFFDTLRVMMKDNCIRLLRGLVVEYMMLNIGEVGQHMDNLMRFVDIYCTGDYMLVYTYMCVFNLPLSTRGKVIRALHKKLWDKHWFALSRIYAKYRRAREFLRIQWEKRASG